MKPKSSEIFIPGPTEILKTKYYKNPKFGIFNPSTSSPNTGER